MKKKKEKNPSGNRVLRWLGRLTPRALWARFALDRWLTPFAAAQRKIHLSSGQVDFLRLFMYEPGQPKGEFPDSADKFHQIR